MDFRGVMPSFADGVEVQEVTVRREGDAYLVVCRVAGVGRPPEPKPEPDTAATKPHRKRSARTRALLARPMGELGSPETLRKGVAEADKDALVAFLESAGTATGVDITEHFGWNSSKQSQVVRACRFEERIRMLGVERTKRGRTMRYTTMKAPELTGTFPTAAINGTGGEQ